MSRLTVESVRCFVSYETYDTTHSSMFSVVYVDYVGNPGYSEVNNNSKMYALSSSLDRTISYIEHYNRQVTLHFISLETRR